MAFFHPYNHIIILLTIGCGILEYLKPCIIWNDLLLISNFRKKENRPRTIKPSDFVDGVPKFIISTTLWDFLLLNDFHDYIKNSLSRVHVVER